MMISPDGVAWGRGSRVAWRARDAEVELCERGSGRKVS